MKSNPIVKRERKKNSTKTKENRTENVERIKQKQKKVGSVAKFAQNMHSSWKWSNV